MSDILAQMKKAHEGLGMKSVDVDFYGWEIFFPALTLKDRAAIREGIDPNDQTELMVASLIHMARREDGTPFFPDTPEMRAELHKMPFELLMKINEEGSFDWSEPGKN